MKQTNQTITINNPLIIIISIGIFSLIIAIVCFYFLDSHIQVSNKTYSASGGMGGFVISFLMLYRAYVKILNIKNKEINNSVEDQGGKSINFNGSSYSPSYSSEDIRLLIQGKRSEKIDYDAFKYVLNEKEVKTNLLALDMGCASGILTIDRFSKFSNFQKIIGVDQDKVKIQEAISFDSSDKFTFLELNAESGNFNEMLRNQAKKHKKNNFDLIFTALTLHHLSDPISTLKTLYNILDNDGYIIARGSDDGSKICFPEYDTMTFIIEKTGDKSIRVSDRENARKLYAQLKEAGFKEIKILYDVVDTVNMNCQERESLFVESFSYRKDYLKKAIEEGNTDLKEDYKLLKKALERFKRVFLQDNFYYMEITYVAVAKK